MTSSAGLHLKSEVMVSNVLKSIIGFILAVVLTAVPVFVNAFDDDKTDEDLSEGQKNMILRARQVMEIEWTPLKDIKSWSTRHDDFKAGITYYGIPYGMPDNPRDYVPYGTSFDTFIDAVNDPESLMYTSNATRQSLAPFYSSDCSAFLSYVWSLETLHKTWDLQLVTRQIGTNLDNVEVGDAVNKYGDHVLLISDIKRSEQGKIIWLETMELIEPIAKTVRYGEDERLSISVFKNIYLDDEYVIIRYLNRDDVKYEHSCIVPIDNDFCSRCYMKITAWRQRAIKIMIPVIIRELTERVSEYNGD